MCVECSTVVSILGISHISMLCEREFFFRFHPCHCAVLSFCFDSFSKIDLIQIVYTFCIKHLFDELAYIFVCGMWYVYGTFK